VKELATTVQTSLSFVFLGLSITSSWGNGHATTYRGLLRELTRRGHRALFLERDVPWYRDNRDLPAPPYGRTALYDGLGDLDARFAADVRRADAVVVGSYVPEGPAVAAWAARHARGAFAFYDIDTPVTLAALEAGSCEYLTRSLVPRFDLYLSFTGGPTLARLEREFGARAARPLYCSVDPDLYYPEPGREQAYDLGYLGTYSDDRQPTLDRLLVEPARRRPDLRFVVGGPQYPARLAWPPNVERREHVAPAEHRAFYGAQRFALNVTRRDMVRAGHSPSVRLFEAAACGTPVVSDAWPGLEEFFTPGEEILLADGPERALAHLTETTEARRREIGERARRRVLAEHTAASRARTLERYAREALASKRAGALSAGDQGGL
jgi:spore maturation protein CgeB